MTRPRYDGGGDGWALAHRTALDNRFHLQDLDAFVSVAGFAANTGDRLFLEYVPDNYSHREFCIRQFGVVAIFDRKHDRHAMEHKSVVVSKAFYLWICRALGASQPVCMPRFFYILGQDTPPWTLVECDITTGDEIQEVSLSGLSWRDTWHQLGLTQARKKLQDWLESMQD